MNNGVQKDWNSEKNSVKGRRENNNSINIFFSPPFFELKNVIKRINTFRLK